VQAPVVSVIIPTRLRPRLLERALRSVLAQSYQAFEVIVVLDGPDRETEDILKSFSDERVRWIVSPAHVGGSEARNIGIRAAVGEYVSLLDDDDEYFPEKLAVQLAAAKASSYRYPVGYCRVISRAPNGELVRPLRSLRPNEPVCEYLFCRGAPFWVPGMIQTNMLFAPRELMLALPFTKGLPRHQDIDWLLKAAQWPGVGFEFSEETLARINLDAGPDRVTSRPDWRFSLRWIRGQFDSGQVTPRGYAAFLLSMLSSPTATAGEWQAAFSLLPEVFKRGRPSLLAVIVHVSLWCIPLRLRRFARLLVPGPKRRAAERPAIDCAANAMSSPEAQG
jgi:glycosyltransferase involved in cell wall biosynthesis